MQRFSNSRVLTAAIVLAGMVAIQPTAHAGSLKSWDKTTSGTARWKSLGNFGNAAVLDKQTGLVWETTPAANFLSIDNALVFCASRVVGGQTGFRLPTVGEISTLFDPSQSPPLPPGHPFTVDPSGSYWLSTVVHPAADNNLIYYMTLNMDPDFSQIGVGNPTTLRKMWCVRGAGGN